MNLQLLCFYCKICLSKFCAQIWQLKSACAKNLTFWNSADCSRNLTGISVQLLRLQDLSCSLSYSVEINCSMIERGTAGNIFFNQFEDIKSDEFPHDKNATEGETMTMNLIYAFLYVVILPKSSNWYVRKRRLKGWQQHWYKPISFILRPGLLLYHLE